MRKLFSVLLAAVLLLAAIPFTGTAIAAASDEYTYTLLNSNSVRITSYFGTAQDIVVPSTLDGYPVTEIGSFAFANNDRLVSVTLPDTLKIIGEDAFSGDGLTESPLETVVIPTGVTTLGCRAFKNCTSMTSLPTIPPTVTTIGQSTFDGTGWLLNRMQDNSQPFVYINSILYKYIGTESAPFSLEIPDGTTALAGGVFASNELLTGITFPQTLLSIGKRTFSGCTGLTEITLPDSLQSVGTAAFKGCENLSRVSFSSAMTTIGDGAFSETALTAVSLPDGLTTIGAEAFRYCPQLTEISLPDSVYAIGATAFHDTAWYTAQPQGLLYINKVLYGYRSDDWTIPETMTALNVKPGTLGIAEGAFSLAGCQNITDFSLPDGLRYIGMMAFYSLAAPTISLPDSVTYLGESAFSGCTMQTLKLSAGLTAISDGAFSDCTELTAVALPDALQHIGGNAFSGCSSLKTLSLNNILVLHDSSFRGCSSLETLTLPGTLRESGGSVFADCTALESVVLESGITTIPFYMFSGCSSLRSVTMPDTVTAINDWAFDFCPLLETIRFSANLTSVGQQSLESTKWYTEQPDGVVYAGRIAYKYKGVMPYGTEITLADGTYGISKSAFAEQAGLTRITLPLSTKTIGVSAFQLCVNLTAANCSGVNQIGEGAFSSCTQLQSVLLSDALTEINDRTFDCCSALETITLPDHLTYIGQWAFDGCNALKTVIIPGSVRSIGKRAFARCNTLESVTIEPGSGTVIGDSAFISCPLLKTYRIAATVTDIAPYSIGYYLHFGYYTYPGVTVYGTTGSAAEAYAAENNFGFFAKGLSGDINGNNTVDLRDAMILYRYISGRTALTDDQLAIANVNGDGDVDMRDAIYLFSLTSARI